MVWEGHWNGDARISVLVLVSGASSRYLCRTQELPYKLRHGDSIAREDTSNELFELKRSAARGIAARDMVLRVVSKGGLTVVTDAESLSRARTGTHAMEGRHGRRVML